MSSSRMMKSLIALTIMLVLMEPIQGKVFEMCELARTLKSFGLGNLPNWICLVQHESSFRTNAKGGPNKDGSYDYGLFQINSRYWCSPGRPGGDCHIDCNKFLDDNISDDVVCAMKIFKRHGFKAWYGWLYHCKNKPLPNLGRCFRFSFYYYNYNME